MFPYIYIYIYIYIHVCVCVCIGGKVECIVSGDAGGGACTRGAQWAVWPRLRRVCSRYSAFMCPYSGCLQ